MSLSLVILEKKLLKMISAYFTQLKMKKMICFIISKADKTYLVHEFAVNKYLIKQ